MTNLACHLCLKQYVRNLLGFSKNLRILKLITLREVCVIIFVAISKCYEDVGTGKGNFSSNKIVKLFLNTLLVFQNIMQHFLLDSNSLF